MFKKEEGEKKKLCIFTLFNKQTVINLFEAAIVSARDQVLFQWTKKDKNIYYLLLMKIALFLKMLEYKYNKNPSFLSVSQSVCLKWAFVRNIHAAAR